MIIRYSAKRIHPQEVYVDHIIVWRSVGNGGAAPATATHIATGRIVQVGRLMGR